MRVQHQRPLPLLPEQPPEVLFLPTGTCLRRTEALALRELHQAREQAEKLAVESRRCATATELLRWPATPYRPAEEIVRRWMAPNPAESLVEIPQLPPAERPARFPSPAAQTPERLPLLFQAPLDWVLARGRAAPSSKSPG